MRIVSLVPSLTELLAELGASGVVGVTDWCTVGAPDDAVRVGGTKNPAVERVLELRPDLVLSNSEENRPEDLDALRRAGVSVHVTFPRSVADVPELLTDVAELVGADPTPLLSDLSAARREAQRRRPATPVAAVTLIWRRPWRAVGPDTYCDDLLRECGFANVLAGWQERYPRLDPALLLRPEVVLLPSEPYPFGADDLPAVRELLGDVPTPLVDGQLLTWHGPRTAAALRAYSSLASELAGGASVAAGT